MAKLGTHKEGLSAHQSPSSESDSNTKSASDTTKLYYEPSCPPHPRLELPQAPYNYIPETVRKESKLLCINGQSKIKMYPGKVFEMENVILDFSKRSFQGDQAIYDNGFLSANCEEVDEQFRKEVYSEKKKLLGIYEFQSIITDTTIEQSVVISTRDDCGNVWHAMADFLRVFTAGLIANVETSERSVLVMDERLMISDRWAASHLTTYPIMIYLNISSLCSMTAYW